MAGKPPAGYVFRPYPKCKYHADGRVVIVQNAGEELALGPTWADRPSPPEVSADPVPDPPENTAPKRRGRPPKERP